MARIDRRNLSRYWWDRNTPGLSLLSADFTTHEYPPHSHEAFVVAVTEAGGSIVKSRGRIEEAGTSTLFVFNPAEPHAGWMGWSRRWRYRALYLTQAAIDEVARGLGVERIPYFTRNRFAERDLIEGFLALHLALEEDRDPFRARELLIDSFGRLFRRHGSGGGRIAAGPRDSTRVEAAVGLMREHHGESLGLAEIAQAVGLTTFQLIGLFKRTTGLTPHAYLTQLRLGMACRHLRHGEPLAEVAAAAGFYDQSALNRHFKRCYGITPLQFAHAARGASTPTVRNFRQYRGGALA
ncbi:MAG: helix-turn-helix domain-containing protein [Alphaproteobacteria bacterium]